MCLKALLFQVNGYFLFDVNGFIMKRAFENEKINENKETKCKNVKAANENSFENAFKNLVNQKCLKLAGSYVLGIIKCCLNFD